MPTLIACFVAGICVTGFLAIWFITAYKELSAKRTSLADLFEQLRLHETLCIKTREGPDAHFSAGMLETSRMLCTEAAKNYNRILRKPMNRLPALLLGFRPAEAENRQEKRKEKNK